MPEINLPTYEQSLEMLTKLGVINTNVNTVNTNVSGVKTDVASVKSTLGTVNTNVNTLLGRSGGTDFTDAATNLQSGLSTGSVIAPMYNGTSDQKNIVLNISGKGRLKAISIRPDGSTPSPICSIKLNGSKIFNLASGSNGLLDLYFSNGALITYSSYVGDVGVLYELLP